MILDLAPHGSLKKMFPIHKISLLSISTISLHAWQTTGNGLPIDQNVLIGHLTTARDKYLLTKTSGCYLSHVIKFNFMRLDFCFKIAMSTHVLAF